MRVLVLYDISTDGFGKGRLRKMMKLCMKWGTRVQNSVFECEVNAAEYREMKAELESAMSPESDSVRLYNLGNNTKVPECLGKADPFAAIEEYVV